MTVQRLFEVVLSVVALCMVAYHLVFAQYIVQQPFGHQNTHLGFAFLMTFIFAAKAGHHRIPWLFLAVLSLLVTLYIQFNYQELDLRAGASHSALETLVGTGIIVLVFIGTWRDFGAPLPLVAILFIVYAYFGHLLPEPWTTSRMTYEAFISKMCMNMDGVYGLLLNVSATFVFLFMVFATLMTTTGAVGFFHQLGILVSRHFRAGPAVMAVITSGLVGSVTGQSAANVAITGSFTIPAMKRAGYRPEQAAAIEAAASSGGPIIPPVMGVAAFLMAGILGISYLKVIAVALIPAVLYMLSCFFYVIFQGRAMQIKPKQEAVDLKELFFRAPIFFVPLCIVIVLFMKGFSPLYASFWAVVSILALGFLRKATRPSLGGLIQGFLGGARLGSQVAISCALLGIVVKVIALTGLGVMLPQILRSFCGHNLLLLLILTGVISIVLGIGLPAATSYVMVAIVMAPVLVTLGIPALTAHMYCFYFCNFSYITPPVALAAIFASKLAGAGYMRTGLEASKVGLAGFLIPFLMIFSPSILLDFSEPIIMIFFKLLSSIIVLAALQAAIVGHFMISLATPLRLTFILSAAVLLYGIYSSSIPWLIAGIITFTIVMIWQRRVMRV